MNLTGANYLGLRCLEHGTLTGVAGHIGGVVFERLKWVW